METKEIWVHEVNWSYLYSGRKWSRPVDLSYVEDSSDQSESLLLLSNLFALRGWDEIFNFWNIVVATLTADSFTGEFVESHFADK